MAENITKTTDPNAQQNIWQGARLPTVNVPITSDLMAQAELYYQGAYEAQRNAAQQAHDESQLLLDQQLAGINANYDMQREQSRKNYEQAYAQAGRQALTRGMQRSSYIGATLGNINLAGNEAQQAINTTQGQQTSNILEQKTLYGRQLQQTLASLSKQQQSDALAKADDLRRRQEELGRQEQQLMLQQQQMQMEYEMWLAEFNAKYGDAGGGGGSGRSGSSNNDSKDDEPDNKRYTSPLSQIVKPSDLGTKVQYTPSLGVSAPVKNVTMTK